MDSELGQGFPSQESSPTLPVTDYGKFRLGHWGVHAQKAYVSCRYTECFCRHSESSRSWIQRGLLSGPANSPPGFCNSVGARRGTKAEGAVLRVSIQPIHIPVLVLGWLGRPSLLSHPFPCLGKAKTRRTHQAALALVQSWHQLCTRADSPTLGTKRLGCINA